MGTPNFRANITLVQPIRVFAKKIAKQRRLRSLRISWILESFSGKNAT
jgi:hypothetical protein